MCLVSSTAERQKNIQKLETVGLSKDTIGKLVSVNPLILTFPLRYDALEVIELLLDAHNSIQSNGVDNGDIKEDEAVLNLLLQSFEKLKEQVNLHDNFKRLFRFFQEMQVSTFGHCRQESCNLQY